LRPKFSKIKKIEYNKTMDVLFEDHEVDGIPADFDLISLFGDEISGRASLYDPSSGVLTIKDPSGLNGGDMNLYRYAKNNPLVNTDWSGLACVTNSLPYTVQASGNPGPGQGSGDQIVFPIQPGQTVSSTNPAYVVPYAQPITDVDYVNPNGGVVNNSGPQSPDKIPGNDVFPQYTLNPTAGTAGPATGGQTNINPIQTIGNIIQNGGLGGLH
jgi:uncharacterized protein RhaS with RHS repeats